MDLGRISDLMDLVTTGVRDVNSTYVEIGFPNQSVVYPKEECAWNAMNSALTCLLFVTFILNILSSIVLFRVPLVTVRGRSNPVYLCIRFLNVCDVLQAFSLILMPVFATPTCGWLGGQISCSIMGFIVLFFLLVSPLITILMAFDRVIALYKPFKYRSHLGLKMLKMLLPSACVLVLVTTTLPIFGVGEYHVVKGRRFCLLDTITENPLHRSYVIGVHTVFLLALLFMLSCTITFQVKLVRMSFDKKHKASKSQKKFSSRRTRNATMTTMAVCCIFIFCYLPYVIRVLVEASTLNKSPTWITWITFGLAFLQPLLNPVVYIGTNVRYRHELQSMMKNISATDMDTSSESGPTHIVSRGAFSGFRRRLSSGGHFKIPPFRSTGSRNSKRGSNKRRTFGSHNSIDGAFSHENGNAHRGHRIPSHHRLLPPLRHLKDLKYSKWEGPTSPHTPNFVDESERKCLRELSSSSGVKSCDSVERMLLSPPYLSATSVEVGETSARFFPVECNRYGRGAQSELHLETQQRERSNTISGDKSPGTSPVPDSNLAGTRSDCSSVPTLLEKRTLARIATDARAKISRRREHESLRARSSHDSAEFAGSSFTKRRSVSLENLSSVSRNGVDDNEVIEIQTTTSYEIKRGRISSLKAKLMISAMTSGKKNGMPRPDTYIDSTSGDYIPPCGGSPKLSRGDEAVSSSTETSRGGELPSHFAAIKRSEGRSSYKRAVEICTPFLVERKPFKRDSGVGDADDVTTNTKG